MNNDPYAQQSQIRFTRYAEAYESPEVKAWIASLTPEQRAHAEKQGLLAPMPEDLNGITPLDEEKADEALFIQAESMERMLSILERNPHKMRALATLLKRKKQGAELMWSVIRFVCGEGSCQSHAERFGMTKQNFHYIVKQFRKYLT